MKCPACGTEIEKNAKFCISCGRQIDNQQPNPQEPAQSAPVATYINNGQPQPQKNNSNVVLIIVLVVIGFIVVSGIIFVIAIRLFMTNISKELNNLDVDPSSSDVVIDDTNDGEVYKTKKDPLGHEVTIVKDSIYIYRVDTSYLYDTVKEMKKKQKVATTGDIEKLNATTKQEEATKIVIEKLKESYFVDRPGIEESLKRKNYTDEEIEFAIKHSGADWKEQARMKAINVLAGGGFSRDDVANVMLYEGYTQEEVDYAMQYDSFDFYEQAAYDACFSKYTSSKYGYVNNREDVKRLLEYDGYTEKEIDFALTFIYDEMN